MEYCKLLFQESKDPYYQAKSFQHKVSVGSIIASKDESVYARLQNSVKLKLMREQVN